MRRKLATLGSLFVATALAATTPAKVDAARSQITATFTQMNVPVDGGFKSFTGQVSYDPAHPAAAVAELSVDTASFDLGDEDYNAEVRKPEWFDSTAHPQATFKSSAIRVLGPNRFEAQGTLTLKGRAQTVKAPIKVTTEGGVRRYEGVFELSRAAFAMGDPEWNEVLDDKVQIRFTIATPAT